MAFWDNCLYALRSLRRDPFLFAAATVILAVCIGANTTVFSIANSILIRPLPYPGAERIDWISERSGPAQQDTGAAPDYYRIREWNRVFEDVAAFNAITLNWTGVERPEQLDTAIVATSFFRVMGMQAMLGRYLAAGEDGSKAPPVAVVSYEFWRNRLGADRQIVGKTIALDRRPHTIIGVMPQGFDFPRGTQLWLPLGLDEAEARILSPSRPIRIVSILARQKPGATPQQVRTEMNRLTFAIRSEYPQQFRQRGFRSDLLIGAIPLQQQLTGQVRPTLLVLTGAVLLLLLIACVNLANLLLARADSRRREMAIRLALGSHRGRVVRQMLIESLALAAPGGLAGIFLAWLAVDALNALKPAILVHYQAISLDWRVLLFTLCLTVFTAVLFGLMPAVSAAAIRVQEALKSASLTHSSGRGAARVRKTLMVLELSLSLVLLIGSGLLARSFLKLVHTDLGFRSDHLLTFRVNPIGALDRNYGPFYSQVLDRLKQLPMARSAALLGDVPLSDEDFYSTGRIQVVGRPPRPFVERSVIDNTPVSPEFFGTLGIPLKSGRIFDAHDFASPAHGFVSPAEGVRMPSMESVVVNEAFVRQMFPGEDPIGRRLAFGPDELHITWTIIGVVGNIRGKSLGADPPAMIYRCACAGNSVFRAAFMVRTAGDPKAAIRAVQQAVRQIDRDQPLSDVKTMDERRDAALAPERFQLILIGAFAGIAILLAAAGVYGIMSYLVSRRIREIGIRMAMGARPADVLRMIGGETGLLLVLAIAIGVAGAWALTRYLRFLLFGVTELDGLTFVLTSLLLAAIVIIASIVPARRAVQIDPMTALREE
jgi:putative ABC transport system permease protein